MEPTDPRSFTARLIEVQKHLKAPKTRTNSFAKYSYRSAEDILEAVKPLLHEQAILLTISDEIVEIGGRVYVRATAHVGDGNGSAIEVTAFAREEEDKKGLDAAQITGSASSYARKYALNGLFLIDDDKDPDTNEYHTQTHDAPVKSQDQRRATEPANGTRDTPHADRPLSDLQRKQMFALMNEIAGTHDWPQTWAKDSIYVHFGIQSTNDLTTKQAGKVIDSLYLVRDKGLSLIDALQQKGA